MSFANILEVCRCKAVHFVWFVCFVVGLSLPLLHSKPNHETHEPHEEDAKDDQELKWR